MNATNIDLGPCEVFIDGTSVGLTIGGVELTYAQEFHETTVDQYGKSVVERFLLGEKWTAKVPLAEFTLANIQKAIPFGTLAGGKITIGAIAGKKASAHAAQLILHPTRLATIDKTFDAVLYKAVQTNQIVIKNEPNGEKILECLFEAMIDTNRADGNMLGLFGDSTA